MSYRPGLIVVAAATVAASLLVPSTPAPAQDWTTVRTNHMPLIDGSGHVVQQSRNVGAFQAVDTNGSEDVQVRFGPRRSVVIAADDNILPLITSEVRNGTLEIGSRGSFRMRGPIRIWITTPNLQAFTSSGSGNVVIHDVDNSHLSLVLNGSGDMLANGRTGRLDVDIHGSGRSRLDSLVATDARVGLFGSGDAVVRANRLLDAQVYGSGTLRYLGNPSQLRRSVYGSGRITASN